MFHNPFGPLLIGAISGIICTAAINFLTRFVEKAKLFDTRGILFIHVLPAFWGGIISAIVTASLSGAYYGSR